MIKILVHNIKKNLWEDQKVSNYLFSLPKIVQEDIIKYNNKKKLSTLIGKLLLQKGLTLMKNKITNINGIKKDKNDKPYINKAPHFNVSHSEDYVVCALSTMYPIGIDIEKIKDIEIDNFEKVLSIGEIDFLKKTKNANSAFFNIWTQKEAIMKADGRGIIPLIMKNIVIEDNKAYLNKNGKFWYLYKLDIDKDYKSYFAIEQPNTNYEIIYVDF